MSQLTIESLRTILVEVAGQDDSFDADTDIATLTFDELGYDSLALMELASTVEKRFGVEIDEEELAKLATPGDLVLFVNGMLAEVS
ncbi:acyl carrier protein [Streptomyces tsukubensis]|uniref:Actinorhodin polyketide synthase n=1 Tax=Streptomyces tsukubensis TaxID=83656 RepID=A0A1V4AEW4_9ACTN|nr:acyl carrier protein [Streptomyces tsukubensis]OON82579.1 actinorhodin polyketide synthase [Streptomyces tsukubensis]QFR92257.1 actinorhodin polyketide synthase [Streptomyces tsukubensis]